MRQGNSGSGSYRTGRPASCLASAPRMCFLSALPAGNRARLPTRIAMQDTRYLQAALHTCYSRFCSIRNAVMLCHTPPWGGGGLTQSVGPPRPRDDLPGLPQGAAGAWALPQCPATACAGLAPIPAPVPHPCIARLLGDLSAAAALLCRGAGAEGVPCQAAAAEVGTAVIGAPRSQW